MPDRPKASTSVSWICSPLAITGSAVVSSSGGSTDRDFVVSGEDAIEGFFLQQTTWLLVSWLRSKSGQVDYQSKIMHQAEG